MDILEIIKYIENIITDDCSNFSKITISSTNSDIFITNIMLKYEQFHIYYKKDLIVYLKENLTKNKLLSIILRNKLDQKYNKFDNFYKLHGITITFIDNELKIKLLTAKDLLGCYVRRYDNNDVIQSEKNVIYCGQDNNDIICGFDI